MRPKVSVVIPFYNCPYIEHALQSVLSQSWEPYEIIVVDDGSTVHADLIRPYFPRIHYLGKSNGGTASALNHGILHATGDYVAWLSSDDLFYRDKINNQVLFMEQNHLLISYTNFNYINGQSQLIQMNAAQLFPSYLDYLRCFLQGNPINGCTVMFKREVFGAIGLFNESLPYTHDYDLWYRAILNGYAPVMLNQSLTAYRNHEGMGTLKYYDVIMAEAAATNARYKGPLQHLISSMGGKKVMYRVIEVNDFLPILLEQLKFCESILDIGSGTGTLLERYEAAVVLGLEIHRPYLLHRKYKSPHIIPVHGDACHMDKLFLPKTFSAVTFIDSIEHFEKKEGQRLLGMAERIAYNRVVVFTPRGFFPQEGMDHYHLQGEHYQKHRSGWEPEDFMELGYAVTVLKGFHHAQNPSFREAFGESHAPVDALLACKTV